MSVRSGDDGRATRASRALAPWWLALTLAACGGGDVGTNGTGAAPSNTVGTVSGFGSVIVDGVRYDDSKALVQVETGAGTFALTEAKFGQRTSVVFTTAAAGSLYDGLASRIEVDPAVKGRIDSKTSDGFVVLGQTIKVNTVQGAGPVTVFDGAASLAALAQGDAVEVHAVRQADGSLLATRVEKQTSLSSLRVGGVVTAVTDSTLQIGGLTVNRASASPSPSVERGQSVVVFAAVNGYTVGASTLVASSVRVKSTATVASSDDTYLSGVVASAGNASFKLDDVTVRSSVAQANDTYVRVKGRYGSDGSFTATEVQVRRSDDDVNGELHGTISGWTAPAVGTAGSFILRGTLVSITAAVAASFDRDKCAVGTALGNGVYVEVEGRPTTTGLQASKIKCEGSDSSSVDGATAEAEGTISGLNTSAKTFTVDGRQVSYNASTYFKDLTEADLRNGLLVKAEGPLSGTVIVAKKIELED